MGKMIEFERPDGQRVNGYLAEPAQATGAPGVVVIQEWWGLNAQIKGVADRYAAAGYAALVPDLYRGKSALEAAEAEHLMTGLNFGDAAGQDVRGAVRHLKAQGRKVGVNGYCMGGALTLLAAVNVPEADAAVVHYGYPPLEYIDASKIRIALLGHWAIEDAFFAIAGVDQLEQKLKAAAVKFEFHRYQAKHAFANETQVPPNCPPSNEYKPEAAATAWERTLDFFGKQLR
jgi:carboxymethylenebutenolidase